MNRDDLRRQTKAAARRLLIAGAERGQGVALAHHWLEPSPSATAPAQHQPLQSADQGETPDEVRPPDVDDVPAPRPAVDFNTMLHTLRTAELRRMPRPQMAMLSAGCSDRSYFDWITASVGPVARHIGIELYLPQPPSLPAGVEWVKNSVGDMSSVGDASVDLVFSGQNFEHLFGDDVVGFLVESHRVLVPGGHLVIDSPNRVVAERMLWTHPEHTIEFTPAEATDLARLAGFTHIQVRGVWQCTDPVTGADLDLWPWSPGEEPDVSEIVLRSVDAADDPEHSFVWWLEARRGDQGPDVRAMSERHRGIYEVAWAERNQRLHHHVGDVTTTAEGRVVSVEAGHPGAMMFGPYVPLVAGTYLARFMVRRRGEVVPEDVDSVLCEVDVCDATGVVLDGRALRARDLPADEWVTTEIGFELDSLAWGGQFRVISTGHVGLDARFVADYDHIGVSAGG